MLVQSITTHVKDLKWHADAFDALLVFAETLGAFQMFNWSEVLSRFNQDIKIPAGLNLKAEINSGIIYGREIASENYVNL